MKKASIRKTNTADAMRAEYYFDYSKARPNCFAMRKNERLIVILDPDIFKVIKSPEMVNNVLRALIATMPQTARRKVAAR